MNVSSTITEAFQLGARIAKPMIDVEERTITVGTESRPPNPPGRAWRLTNSEWVEMLQVVRAVSMFLAGVCGSMPRQPIPSPETLSNFSPYGQGVRFWFAAEGYNADEMAAGTLKHIVRDMWEYGFLDGTSIRDASSHSDAELWSDVIIPAIERGEIEVTVWGEPLL